jgi:C-terminal processing protease CtpA/Prc
MVDAAEGPVVVDLRANPGGENTTYGPFRDALREKAATGAGQVALLTSRDTFSAAGNFATELKVGPDGDRMLLVGEPPGGGLNIYGDTATVTLEHSGIVVLISRRYHEKAPGDDRLQIEPDIPVEATWEDVAAGRDPVLDAALAGLHGEGAP